MAVGGRIGLRECIFAGMGLAWIVQHWLGGSIRRGALAGGVATAAGNSSGVELDPSRPWTRVATRPRPGLGSSLVPDSLPRPPSSCVDVAQRRIRHRSGRRRRRWTRGERRPRASGPQALAAGGPFDARSRRGPICLFTSKRIIAVNVQGITGKKKDFTSLPMPRSKPSRSRRRARLTWGRARAVVLGLGEGEIRVQREDGCGVPEQARGTPRPLMLSGVCHAWSDLARLTGFWST
jgi:hypothetical protein